MLSLQGQCFTFDDRADWGGTPRSMASMPEDGTVQVLCHGVSVLGDGGSARKLRSRACAHAPSSASLRLLLTKLLGNRFCKSGSWQPRSARADSPRSAMTAAVNRRRALSLPSSCPVPPLWSPLRLTHISKVSKCIPVCIVSRAHLVSSTATGERTAAANAAQHGFEDGEKQELGGC